MRKNVNIYYAGFKHRSGGAYFHVVNAEKGLKELDYEVNIITLDTLPFIIRYIPHVLQKVGNILNFPIGFLWRQWLIKQFYKIKFKNSADIEIFEDIYTYWKSNTNSIVILHALWSDNLQGFEVTEKQRIMIEKKEVNILNNIESSVVTVSVPYKDFLLSRLKSLNLQKKLGVVELGVDISKFSSKTNNTKSMIFVGLLEARKNVKFLLDIYSRLVKEDNQFTLTIVGDGTQKDELTEYIKVNKINNVVFKGRLTNDEVVKELPNHKYYLHTSTKESFSYSLLEAKLSGLITIAYSGLEVPSEFIDIKVDDFEVKTWITKILGFESNISKFGKDKFSYQKMLDNTLIELRKKVD
jgi:glycosyltransferase involved in cell wall biosynthesis